MAITADLQARIAARNAALIEANAKAYAKARQFGDDQAEAELAVCNAVVNCFDDGDCLAQREYLMDEYDLTEAGYPDDDRIAERNAEAKAEYLYEQACERRAFGGEA